MKRLDFLFALLVSTGITLFSGFGSAEETPSPTPSPAASPDAWPAAIQSFERTILRMEESRDRAKASGKEDVVRFLEARITLARQWVVLKKEQYLVTQRIRAVEKEIIALEFKVASGDEVAIQQDKTLRTERTELQAKCVQLQQRSDILLRQIAAMKLPE